MAEQAKTFTIRPFSHQEKSDLSDAFRIYLSGSAMVLLKMKAGDLCALRHQSSESKTAIAWPAPDKLKDFVVQTSRTLQNLYGLKLGDNVVIEKIQKALTTTPQIVLWDITQGAKSLSDDGNPQCEQYLRDKLARAQVSR